MYVKLTIAMNGNIMSYLPETIDVQLWTSVEELYEMHIPEKQYPVACDFFLDIEGQL